MRNREAWKTSQMGEFFARGAYEGYRLRDVWEMMLTTKPGRGLLIDEDYIYFEHNSGGTDFYLALEECKGKYPHKEQSLQHFKDLYGTGTRAELLAEFIEFAHSRFNLEYEKIFSKFDIESFFDRFGKFLGNYDDRIVRDFLL